MRQAHSTCAVAGSHVVLEEEHAESAMCMYVCWHACIYHAFSFMEALHAHLPQHQRARTRTRSTHACPYTHARAHDSHTLAHEAVATTLTPTLTTTSSTLPPTASTQAESLRATCGRRSCPLCCWGWGLPGLAWCAQSDASGPVHAALWGAAGEWRGTWFSYIAALLLKAAHSQRARSLS